MGGGGRDFILVAALAALATFAALAALATFAALAALATFAALARLSATCVFIRCCLCCLCFLLVLRPILIRSIIPHIGVIIWEIHDKIIGIRHTSRNVVAQLGMVLQIMIGNIPFGIIISIQIKDTECGHICLCNPQLFYFIDTRQQWWTPPRFAGFRRWSLEQTRRLTGTRCSARLFCAERCIPLLGTAAVACSEWWHCCS